MIDRGNDKLSVINRYRVGIDHLSYRYWQNPMSVDLYCTPVRFSTFLFKFSIDLCLVFVLTCRTNMTSLTNIHNLGWTWWRNTWSLWRSEQRSNKTMQSSYGKWFEYGGPCSCVQCMLHAHVWTCSVCVRAELWLTVKWTGPVTCLEQNRTCRHLRALVLALDQRISAYSHAGLLVGSVSARPWRSFDSHAILCVFGSSATLLYVLTTQREREKERKWEQTNIWL